MKNPGSGFDPGLFFQGISEYAPVLLFVVTDRYDQPHVRHGEDNALVCLFQLLDSYVILLCYVGQGFPLLYLVYLLLLQAEPVWLQFPLPVLCPGQLQPVEVWLQHSL